MPSRVAPSRTLRVAILAPISWRVPPRGYGPWEQFASLLTEGLVRRGVDVTLFATADSITTARLVGTAPTGYSEDPGLDAKAWEALHVSAVFERAAEFDLIHNSCDFLPLTYSGLVKTPVVTTIHGFSSEQIVPVFEKYNRCGYYVAISDADRHEHLVYVATIHHGIDLSEFELQQTPGDYLLFFGRIHPDKGTAEAIDVAERVGMPLTIAGIIQDRGYFEQLVEPRLDGEQVSYIGPVARARRGDLLGGARALLHLVNFDEPFGFSVVEAMACGTPVIAQRRGSMAEIVRRRRERLPRRDPRRGRRRRRRCECARPRRRARISRGSLRRRADGGRLPRSLSGCRGAPPRRRDRQRGSSLSPRWPADRFRVGVNYWPARTAMSWWSRFDREEVAADFARIAACGLDSVRVFLTWEDFQPTPNRVDRAMLERLVAVADLAGDLGLALIPTLFTGHMSGVNWIPAWALGGSLGDRRFRVVSRGRRRRPGSATGTPTLRSDRCPSPPGGAGRRRPRWPRGGLGLGSRQRELQLCDPSDEGVGAHLARAARLSDPWRRRDGAR